MTKATYILPFPKTLSPRIFTLRSSDLPVKAELFGPFPDSTSAKFLLKTLRRIFPYLTKSKHPPHPCLYCHIGLCPGPNPPQSIYRRQISRIRQILNGRIKKIKTILSREMKVASYEENFEKALTLRRQLESLEYVTSGWSGLSHLYQTVDLSEDKTGEALKYLQTVLRPYFPTLKSLKRIECIDISHLGNRAFVGSLTVMVNGKLDNSKYRQFKINTKDTPDDQFMIREVVFRRLKHPEWGIPNLLVVDGGKPQVSAAITAINHTMGIKPNALIGLAKKFETIVIKKGDGWEEVDLPHNSSSLNLLRQLRDEAHRFANRYRRKLVSLNKK